jgi:hypothetical protein
MAGSFGGTRSADRLRRLIPRCLPAAYTRNQKLAIYFWKMWSTFRGGGLKFADHVRVLFPSFRHDRLSSPAAFRTAGDQASISSTPAGSRVRQNVRSRAARTAIPVARAWRHNGGYPCVSLTSLVAQRDAGIGRWTLRAAASSCALAAWAAAAGSAVAVPGMAACRVPAHWMIRGWCPSPARDSRSRTLAASGSSWRGFPPLALCVVTGGQFRRQDDGPVRHAPADGGASATAIRRPCRRQIRTVRHEAFCCIPSSAGGNLEGGSRVR